MKKLTPSNTSVNVDLKKRKTLGGIATLGAGAGLSIKAPYVFARTKTKLRVLGTHVTLQEELRQRAMEDLGIEIEYEAKGSASVLQKASMQPGSFDLYEQWSNSMRVLWGSGAIQPIEKKRIHHWGEINSLTQTGQLTENAIKAITIEYEGTASMLNQDLLTRNIIHNLLGSNVFCSVIVESPIITFTSTVFVNSKILDSNSC